MVHLNGAKASYFGLYSLPGDPFCFLIRTDNASGGDTASLMSRLELGEYAEVSAPRGGFPLLENEPSLANKHLHFVATGTAIAPMRSAIVWALKRRLHFASISLDFGIRSREHIPDARELEQWTLQGLDLGLHVSSEGATRAHRMASRRGQDMREAAIVAAGHTEMLEELRQDFVLRGGETRHFLTNF